MMAGADVAVPEPAIRARVAEWQLGAPGTGLVWLGQTLVASGGDGRLHFTDVLSGELLSAALHQGAILALAADPTTGRVITGGDDGRVMAATAEGSEQLLHRPGRWIDAVAVGRTGMIAAGVGKEVLLWQQDDLHSKQMPSTAAGLAFDARGTSLAAAHYGGVSLIDVTHPKRAPRLLAWKGSHIGVTFNPNGRFVVSVMSENALHGWRIKDAANMAMSGYPTKPRSLSWSADGRLLTSSGADGAIVWSFAGRDGPMGTSAMSLGERGMQVTALAWHPSAPMLALGYRDGSVQLCRAEDGDMLPMRVADGQPVKSLGFDPGGRFLGTLTEIGSLGRVDLAS
ncbi:WD40 repeat domain-containing protein [Devosia beringensis]|uniref:WD40 repeat domain-containing protein n=1 Tax=Devosia beringensis TaxID=2657486 RepID=UPI00186B81FE|nr:WD40 repeat domain-containing protein [Devosia beringensis]